MLQLIHQQRQRFTGVSALEAGREELEVLAVSAAGEALGRVLVHPLLALTGWTGVAGRLRRLRGDAVAQPCGQHLVARVRVASVVGPVARKEV